MQSYIPFHADKQYIFSVLLKSLSFLGRKLLGFFFFGITRSTDGAKLKVKLKPLFPLYKHTIYVLDEIISEI